MINCGLRAFLTGVALVFAGSIEATDASPQSAAPQVWYSRGGQTTLWLNQGALTPLGLRIAGVEPAQRHSPDAGDYITLRFAVDAQTGFAYRQQRGVFSALEESQVHHQGGFVLQWRDGSLDLRRFQIRRRPGGRAALELADASGQAWFTLDHVHHFLGPGNVLSLRHLDLRIGPALAKRLGNAELTGQLVGGAQVETRKSEPARRDSTGASGGVCQAVWPSSTAFADVQMIRLATNWDESEPDGVNVYRCGRPDGQGGHTLPCTADSTDGTVVLAPDASLRNTGTATVAWHPKFSPPSAPYGNDQHPFLVWNLYRLGPDGRLQQVGASAAKHAFHTINGACGCQEDEALYPGCEDTYGGFSNDYSRGLAPRAEIIPFTARWGRCGSLYDANCDGQRDGGDAEIVPDDAYSPLKHLAVREAEIDPARHPGARWFVEYWYVVRDDIDPWNTMGLMEVRPQKRPGQGADPHAYAWRFDVTDFTNGAMVHRWRNLASPDGWSMTSPILTPLGRAELAVRVVRQDGRYRYDYVLFNLDFASATTEGTEPNLRVTAMRGLDRLAVATDPQAFISAMGFLPVAGEPGQWSASREPAAAVWQTSTADLDWGKSLSFTLVSDRPPTDGTATVGSGAARWAVATLVPVLPVQPPRRRPETYRDALPVRHRPAAD
ncbi:hypothetical protein [Tahibacter amnicola]|uniref:Uncharacterized protein n=1 Tax=Tahibacter amnicola TaxID=2976241 RepID=A0ABY6BB73_9GAMM|nr:hypothetical protein [Tahibacter amnicola]UXI66787.1 hypothetical protein N4264_18810 [Tahibacter amnicola]